ncbi:potassium transporter Kup [Desulforhabdus amnigena]|jgi:KUP system potassium uptake protein|nr:potassium transporter Kup [Desulforhabdus amnigena]
MNSSQGSPGYGQNNAGAEVFSRMEDGSRLVKLSLAALGVAFGDIGTSPLYAIRECFYGEYGIAVTKASVLGVLSLIFWALLMIVTLKYLVFILRADNHGEGGVIALTALVKTAGAKAKSAGNVLVLIGLFAACLLYGDGMITPAISVLSAVEGIRIITPLFEPFVIPLTVVILGGLFLLQHRGTARVGILFGPVILVWFGILGFLGACEIIRNPEVLRSILPWYGFEFLLMNKMHGFLVLGAVFLVVTGAEALYADMGHFGKRPIQWTWICLVFPALALNYFGQGAVLLARPEEAHHPFYALVPPWAMIPMVILSTLATIIASQAVITGAFSLTKQAIQLGYLPRMRTTHTSATQMGQIYVAPINWLLMVSTIGLVLGFQSSSRLASAYGVAVTSTMLITTGLFYVVARTRWGWNRPAAGLLCGLFGAVDLAFFSANISKILHGAWFPLAIGGIIFTLMLTWERGREILSDQLKDITMSFFEFKKNLELNPPQSVRGQAIFLTGNPYMVPAALMHNLAHNKVLHSEIAFLHFKTEDVPRVPNLEKVEVEKLGGGFFRIIAHHGFMEEPHIEKILSLAREQGLEFKMENTSFFLGRERLTLGKQSRMSRWRAAVFRFMSRNALEAATFYEIPTDQIIEVGVQLEL